MKFHSSLSVLSLVLATSHAQRPFGGGPLGDRAGFPGIQPDFVTKTCDAAFACNRRNNEQGIFVCRETYHPITADVQTRAECIPNDRAFESDDCGCCLEDCPEQPDYQVITCDNQDDIAISRSSFSGGHGRGGRHLQGGRGGRGEGGDGEEGDGERGRGNGDRIPDDAVVVCRELYNPFTGVLSPVTIPISPEKSLDADICGCCNSECPEEIGSQIFERPDQVELDWCEPITNCTLPRRQHHGRDEDEDEDAEVEDDVEEQGAFVCRSMVNMLTGVAESQPLCIPTDRAWETDDCGCCGLECPVRPERVDIECTAEIDQCERRNGESGVFVCRDLFHPLDGGVFEKALCIESDNSWATDECGCCGDDCPVTPEGGFASEDAQLMELTVESELSVDESAASYGSLATAGLVVATALFGL
jgi:hypothetical protein